MKINDFRLERFFAEHEFTSPHLLCCSDCESISVADLLQMSGGHDALSDLRLGYTDSLGHPQLRGEIAALYDSISTDEVIVFTGAEEGIFLLANSLLGPGDHGPHLGPHPGPHIVHREDLGTLGREERNRKRQQEQRRERRESAVSCPVSSHVVPLHHGSGWAP